MSKRLPEMPNEHPKIKLTLEAELDHDFERFSTGHMRLTMERCEVKEGDNLIGHVATVIPAGVVVSIGKRSYYISAQTLWNAVREAETNQATT